MQKLNVLAAFAALAIAGSSTAVVADEHSGKTDVITTIDEFNRAFNQNDDAKLATLCDTKTTLVDEFAPHLWQGTGACGNWVKAFRVLAKNYGIEKTVVSMLPKPRVDITGDVAYVVAPSSVALVIKGKHVADTGDVNTLVLKKIDGNWRITAWTWSKNPKGS